MQTFKVGDRVKCVDPSGRLVLFELYVITGVDREYVSVDGDMRGYLYASRFVKMPTFKGNFK